MNWRELFDLLAEISAARKAGVDDNADSTADRRKWLPDLTLAANLLVRPLAFRAPTEAARALAQDVPALFDALCDTEILRELRELRWTWMKERPDSTR